MCTYRGAKFIADQLNSIANQTHLPNEVVIVDDASDDETTTLLTTLERELPLNTRIYNNKYKLGVIKNFESAVRLCKGDVIFFSDQDDIWEKGKIASHLETYSENPECGYVFSDALIMDGELSHKICGLWNAVRFDAIRQKHYRSGLQLETMLNGGNFVYGNTLSFRARYKDVLLPIESSSHGCTHDVWISHVLSAIGAYGIALPLQLVRYRQHSNQQAGAGRKQSLHRRLQSMLFNESDTLRDRAKDIASIGARVKIFAPDNTAALTALSQCAQHLMSRANLQGIPLTHRFLFVLRELVTARYSKYSSSWKSAAKDLLDLRRSS